MPNPKNLQPEHRIGGRGCPSCGSHNTYRLATAADRNPIQWCETCGHRWVPCTPHCRGYELLFAKSGPAIRGCQKCGVPDKIAVFWPEAYRALSLKMAKRYPKLEPVPSAR